LLFVCLGVRAETEPRPQPSITESGRGGGATGRLRIEEVGRRDGAALQAVVPQREEDRKQVDIDVGVCVGVGVGVGPNEQLCLSEDSADQEKEREVHHHSCFCCAGKNVRSTFLG